MQYRKFVFVDSNSGYNFNLNYYRIRKVVMSNALIHRHIFIGVDECSINWSKGPPPPLLCPGKRKYFQINTSTFEGDKLSPEINFPQVLMPILWEGHTCHQYIQPQNRIIEPDLAVESPTLCTSNWWWILMSYERFLFPMTDESGWSRPSVACIWPVAEAHEASLTPPLIS